MRRLFLLTLIGLIMFSLSRPARAEAETGIHRAITQVSDWLNTERPLTAADLKGRIILLDFWTFCCINCIHVIPDLHELEQEFGDKLTVIGVHSAKFQNERDEENIRQAVLRYDIEHPVVNDAQFKIWQSFAVRSWPSLILINPEGKIAAAYSGEGNKARLARDIQSLIAEYGDAVNTQKLPLSLEKNKRPKTVLDFPGKLAIKSDTKDIPTLFVSDSGHNRIVGGRYGAQMRIETIIGSGRKGARDGAFAEAEFNAPQGLLYEDGKLYIADTGNHLLRLADFKTGQVTTLAGTGARGGYAIEPGSNARTTALASPWDLAFYNGEIVIANAGSHQLWAYDIKGGTLRILAGNGRESIDDGKYPENSLSQPSGLAVLGDKLYFVDSETSSLRVLQNGTVTTLIGTGLFDFGFADGAQGKGLLQHALGLAAAEDGIYIADSYNHAIRFYDFKTKALSTVTGNGKRGDLNEPNAVLNMGKTLLVADTNNNRLVSVDRKSGKIDVVTIEPPAKKLALVEDGSLPNLFAAKPAAVAEGKPISIELRLPPRWKINVEAPSFLALFQGKNLLQSFDLAAIRAGKLSLPKLSGGQSYRLQGTLYYCEDKEGSLCLIRSFDREIRGGGEVSSVELDLR